MVLGKKKKSRDTIPYYSPGDHGHFLLLGRTIYIFLVLWPFFVEIVFTKLTYPIRSIWIGEGEKGQLATVRRIRKKTLPSSSPTNYMIPGVPDSSRVALNSIMRAWNLCISEDWTPEALQVKVHWQQHNSLHGHRLVNGNKAGSSVLKVSNPASHTTYRGHLVSRGNMIFLLLGIVSAISLALPWHINWH